LKILITGASGLLGSKMAEIANRRDYQVYSGYIKDKPLHGTPVRFDVSDNNQVGKAFEKVKPEVVVHSAALTDVDKCETDKQLAWKTNVIGTKNIAEATRRNKAFLIYVSTDYVFNGQKGKYDENDKPDPINYYGLTKLEAECLIEGLIEDYCIARGSVIYGSTPAAGKINFALWLLNKLNRKEQVNIVIDQWNSPTLNSSMAEMALEIAERKLKGIFHTSGATRISRFDFARLIAQTFSLDDNLINAATSANFSWAANRPRDSSLNTAKAHQTLKIKPLKLDQALERMKKEAAESMGRPDKKVSRI
jgi:dTDP-4-dehydrorhamnose reductase